MLGFISSLHPAAGQGTAAALGQTSPEPGTARAGNQPGWDREEIPAAGGGRGCPAALAQEAHAQTRPPQPCKLVLAPPGPGSAPEGRREPEEGWGSAGYSLLWAGMSPTCSLVLGMPGRWVGAAVGPYSLSPSASACAAVLGAAPAPSASPALPAWAGERSPIAAQSLQPKPREGKESCICCSPRNGTDSSANLWEQPCSLEASNSQPFQGQTLTCPLSCFCCRQ